MRDQLTPRVVGVFELIIFPLQNHIMNTSDIVCVFTQVFKNDITYDAQFDEVFVNDTFDIFKYPVNLREMFYKYYPKLYDMYSKTLKDNYDMKKLENDITKDSELVCIPLELIDTSKILDKTFGKLLSQDYEFMNLKTARERSHYKLEYVVKYIDELGGWNINKYLSLGYVKPIDVICLKGATKYMDVKYLSEFFNKLTDKKFKALTKTTTDEFCDRFASDKQLKDFNENAMQYIVQIFTTHNVYHPIIYDEKYKNTLFPIILKHAADTPLRLADVQFLTDYFIREMDMDKEKDNSDFQKRKAKTIYYIVINSSKECNKKLTSVELLKRIYPVGNTSTSYDDVFGKFNASDADINLYIQRYASESYLLNNYGKGSINDVQSLHNGRSEKVFDLYDMTVPEIYKHITHNASYKYIARNIPEHSINDVKLIKRRDPWFYKFFDYYNNDDILTYIMNSVDDESDDDSDDSLKIEQIANEVKEVVNTVPKEATEIKHYDAKKYVIEHYFDVNVGKLPDTPNEAFVREYIRLNEDNNEELLRLCDAYGLFERIAESAPSFVGYWFEQMILRETINGDNFDEFWKEYGDRVKSRQTLGFAWIKTYHEEPPFEIYASPNVNVDGDTNASLWKKHVNVHTVPMEMTSEKYYDYMIKTRGIKKDPNSTIMYTFFSNSLENKIIFCKSDVEFDYPAVERYSIPIGYDKIKPFLHEELETNDICMFASLDKDDWSKIAGGNSDFDIVCFSDCKNIYRERTPLKRVIEYIIMHIELTFGEECEEI